MAAFDYYTTTRIAKTDSHYNLVFGERSNGKTTAVLLDIVKNNLAGLGNGQYVRQMELDIVGRRGENVYQSLEHGGKNKDVNLIEEATNGEFTTTKYHRRAWYLGKKVKNKNGEEEIKYESEPFCFATSLSGAHHDKSATPPNVTTIVFDEFLPMNGSYLVDETALFRNMVSTTVRESARTKIYLVANSLTWNSPYFKLFGVTRQVKDMNPGDLTVFKLPMADDKRGEMRVALEYCRDSQKTGGKDSDVYFAFPDQHSAMITGGKFAVPEYPKCPKAFSRQNVKATYWIDTDDVLGTILRARLMRIDRDTFVFVDSVSQETHERLRDDRRDLFYSREFRGDRNHYICPAKVYRDTRTAFLADSIARGKIFFETNEAGEDFTFFVTETAQRSVMTLG